MQAALCASCYLLASYLWQLPFNLLHGPCHSPFMTVHGTDQACQNCVIALQVKGLATWAILSASHCAIRANCPQTRLHQSDALIGKSLQLILHHYTSRLHQFGDITRQMGH